MQALDKQSIDGHIPRFSKGPLIPVAGKLCSALSGEGMDHFMMMSASGVYPHHPMQTSSVATELPTSMTHKILSNAMVGAQVKAARQQGSLPTQVVQLLNTVFPEDLVNVVANIVCANFACQLQILCVC